MTFVPQRTKLLLFSACENEIISISRAWEKEKIRVSDRIRTYDLPNTGRTLCPLSYGELMESEVILLGSYLTRVLHTAKISNVENVVYDERMRDGEF